MATFISLTNELLRRLNEVEIAQENFSGVRNIQALAKDAVNSSVRHILQVAQEWPFTLTTYTQPLTIGVQTYSFPADVSSVDLDSFYLKKHPSLNNEPKKLGVVSYPEYLRYFRPQDDGGAEGAPERIFQTNGEDMGVSPVPNGAYEIEYLYYASPDSMSAYGDVCIVPDRFKHVVITGAMMYMMRFRSNEQAAQASQRDFEDGIKVMRRLLLDEPVSLTSTMSMR
jgi:hypothetical protein